MHLLLGEEDLAHNSLIDFCMVVQEQQVTTVHLHHKGRAPAPLQILSSRMNLATIPTAMEVGEIELVLMCLAYVGLPWVLHDSVILSLLSLSFLFRGFVDVNPLLYAELSLATFVSTSAWLCQLIRSQAVSVHMFYSL